MMRHSAPRTGARLLGLMFVLAGPLAAQKKAPPPPPPPLGIDVDVGVGFVTSNIERGVVLSNLPQLTPHLMVKVKPGSGNSRIILGFDGFAELTTPRDGTKFGLAADSLKRPNFTEARPSLTFVQGFGKKSVAAVDVGFTYVMYPNVAGTTKDNNTGQFRVGLGAPGSIIPLRVGYMYETGGLEGSSLEGGLGGDFHVSPTTAVVLRADAGYAVDVKAPVGASPAIAKLARKGFTHLDLTAGLDLNVAGAGVRPLAILTYARDTAAVVVPGPDKYRWLARFGVSLGIRKSTLPPPAPSPPPSKPAAAARPAAATKKP